MRLLYLAPQASLPPMDGADNRAWHLYEGLVQSGISGCFLGRTVLIRELQQPQHHSADRAWRESKALAALVALVTNRDYWQLRHLLPGTELAAAQLARQTWDVVLTSMLYSLPLAWPFLARGIPLVLDTHNYDPAWFGSLAANSHNPALRWLCWRAVRNSHAALRRLPSGVTLVHVSEADAARYRHHRPDLAHIVVENGTALCPRQQQPEYGGPGKRRLLFVGSLSTLMNQQALHYFARCFWPTLRDYATFKVAGSRPPPSIYRLCARQRWDLCADISAQQLEQCYSQAHFAVLPFEYGEGSKLKLLEACGRAVPVLATEAGLCGFSQAPPLATVSNQPARWVERIHSGLQPSLADLKCLASFAEDFSWQALSCKLADALQYAQASTQAQLAA